MVMVGSSLMVAVSGIGAGFTAFFTKQTSNLAGNVMFVNSAPRSGPGGGGGGGPGGGAVSSNVAKITLNAAVEDRLRSMPFVTETIPTYSASVEMESQGKTKNYNVLSIDPEKITVLAPTLQYVDGSTMSPNDPSSIIISADVAQPPGDDQPFLTLGQTVKLTYSYVDPITQKTLQNVKSFVVKAIMQETGNPTIDRAVIINPTIGNSLFQKSGKFDSIIITAASPAYVDVIEQEIKQLYGNNIGINSVKGIIKTVQNFTSGTSSFLLSIAIVSLIVGAVGIITTLYTSVIERTREIGTLKAIGARDSYVLSLFLAEALLIGILGASSGLITGIAVGYILGSGFGAPGGGHTSPIYLPYDMMRVWLITVGLSFLAGLFPALKAARLLPIMALKRD